MLDVSHALARVDSTGIVVHAVCDSLKVHATCPADEWCYVAQSLVPQALGAHTRQGGALLCFRSKENCSSVFLAGVCS